MSDFLLPDIGEGIVECEVVKWLVAEGDSIAEDQPVVEVSTDKAVMEITAPDAGRVTRLYCGEGETACVHAPLFAYVVSTDTDSADSPAARAPAPEAATPETEIPQLPAPQDEQTSQGEPTLQDEPAPTAAKPFLLPDLGEGIVECEVVAWRVAEGEEIAEDQPVVEVSTDKAVMEITAPEAGRLARHHCQVGESARVHTPLFTYHPATSETSTAFGTTTDTAPGAAADAPQSTSQSTPLASVSRGTSAPAASSAGRRRIPASPAVRRRVRELGVRLEEIPGSGKDGRVLKEDVLAFQQQQEKRQEQQRAKPQDSQPKAATPGRGTPMPEAASDERTEPLRGVRAVMARRMSEAASTIPHFAYGDEFDVTELLALRERLKGDFEARGERLTLMPLLMKALALAVTTFPLLNCRLSAAADAIHYQAACNIGMAVDSASGLLVPNVKHVERLSLREVASEVERLTRAAREGRVEPGDLKGGTISISNIGVLGGTYAMPIINAPEVAIVALGRVQRLPRFDADGNVVARSIMTVTWSGDHRVLDGGTMARFCNRWKGYLEAPETMLADLR